MKKIGNTNFNEKAFESESEFVDFVEKREHIKLGCTPKDAYKILVGNDNVRKVKRLDPESESPDNGGGNVSSRKQSRRKKADS